MLTVLFWNLNQQKNCLETLGRLVASHGLDLLVLAECPLGMTEILETLNTKGHTALFHYNPGNCRRIVIYSKLSSRFVRPVFESNWLTMRRLQLMTGLELLLVAAHLPSKLHESEASQSFILTELASDIRRIEERLGHSRTLVIGDLNMHPFEHGMVAAAGLHAVMDRRIASRGQRRVNGKNYSFFYNPMWSLLGDASPGQPGTYYRQDSEQVAYFWKMFDQVLLRPSLLPMFDNTSLSILDSDGEISFLKSNGTPDGTLVSDHLPVLFRLNC